MGSAAPALVLRILLVGAERVLLGRLGRFGSPGACAAAFFAIGALVLFPFAGLGHVPNWRFLTLAIPSGLLYAVAYWFYVSALASGEIGAVAPLATAGTLLVVLFAAAVHAEPLGPLKIGGAVLLTAGCAAVQGAARLPGARWGPALRMLTYAVLSAAVRMLDKAAAAGQGPVAFGAYAFVVFAVVACCHVALLAGTGGLGPLVRLLRRQPGAALAAGACNGLSFLLLIGVLATVPVSVAEPLSALSLLVSLGLAALWLGEPVRARWLPTLAIIAGAWLLGTATPADREMP